MRTGDRMFRQLAVGASGGRAGVRDCKMPRRNVGRPRSIILLVVAQRSGPLHFAGASTYPKSLQLFGLMRSSSNNPAAARRGNADCCLNFQTHAVIPENRQAIPHPEPVEGRDLPMWKKIPDRLAASGMTAWRSSVRIPSPLWGEDVTQSVTDEGQTIGAML